MLLLVILILIFVGYCCCDGFVDGVESSIWLLVGILFFIIITAIIDNGDNIVIQNEVGRYDVIVENGDYYYAPDNDEKIVPIPYGNNTHVIELSEVEKPYVIAFENIKTIKNRTIKYWILSPFITKEEVIKSYMVYLPSE